MPGLESRRSIWHIVAMCILLAYPIMGSKWFPFGGGARYLNVLAAPVCLLLLIQARSEIKPLLREAWRWCQPFLPFVLAWMFVQFWHRYSPLDANPLTQLFWCALLYLGARLTHIAHRELAIVAGLGSVAYCVIAIWEVYVQGIARAWGGVYQNRFGEFTIWVAALCVLHALLAKPEERNRKFSVLLLLTSLAGLLAAILTGSRGALMALPVLMLVLLFKTLDWRRGALAVVTMLVVLGIASYSYQPIYSGFELSYREARNYFDESVFTPTSIGIRLELARVALVTWVDHPWLGIGYTSLKQLYDTYPALGVPDPIVLATPGFHSDWFQAIGMGGALLLAGLLATCGWMLLAAKRDPYRLAFLGFSIVFSFSEIFFTNKMGLSLLMACWALYAAAERNREPGR